MDKYTLIRKCYFRPYLKGQGPTYTLELHDEHIYSNMIHYLSFKLKEHDSGETRVIFEGHDFGLPVGYAHADDSDQTIKSLMSFLTLRKGDTDDEYFENYTQEQLDWSDSEAEALSMAVYDKFGE